MSETAIKNKIEDLNFWLRSNQEHPDYCLKHQEREKLKIELLKPKFKVK